MDRVVNTESHKVHHSVSILGSASLVYDTLEGGSVAMVVETVPLGKGGAWSDSMKALIANGRKLLVAFSPSESMGCTSAEADLEPVVDPEMVTDGPFRVRTGSAMEEKCSMVIRRGGEKASDRDTVNSKKSRKDGSIFHHRLFEIGTPLNK